MTAHSAQRSFLSLSLAWMLTLTNLQKALYKNRDKITIIHSQHQKTKSKIMLYKWSDYVVALGYKRQNKTIAVPFTRCIATLQGQAGSWYSCRWKNTHGAVGISACHYSQVGEPCTLQAVCLSACLMSWTLLPSMAPIMAPVPLCVSHHHCPPSRESLPV